MNIQYRIFIHVSSKERCLLRAHILTANFSISGNGSFIPSEEIRRITNDISVETNFSRQLLDVTTSINSCL